MSWWGFALWGVFGGFAAAGVGFVRVVSDTGCVPWATQLGKDAVQPGAYAAAATVRMVLGGGLAWAGGSAGVLSNALAAVAVGLAAPMVASQLTDIAQRLLSKDAAS